MIDLTAKRTSERYFEKFFKQKRESVIQEKEKKW